jgi:hypothetical protein
MQPLTEKNLWPLPVYEGVRDEFRRSVIEAKKLRRLTVGPYMTFVFENRLTVKFQIMEVLRAERATRREQVIEELEGFNTMLPAPGALSSTLLIELVGNEVDVKAELARLTGLAQSVYLQVDGRRVPGEFDQGRDDGTKVSAVQYVRFAMGKLERPFVASTVELVVDHPHYRHRLTLSDDVKRSLAADLEGP